MAPDDLFLGAVYLLTFLAGFTLARAGRKRCAHTTKIDVVNSRGELLHRRCDQCGIDLQP